MFFLVIYAFKKEVWEEIDYNEFYCITFFNPNDKYIVVRFTVIFSLFLTKRLKGWPSPQVANHHNKCSAIHIVSLI